MYSRITLAYKFLKYLVTSSNGKGHGIHSPFVFDFVTHILNDQQELASFREIELLRSQLLTDTRMISVVDLGAGSGLIKTRERLVRDIALSSLKPKKFSQLLFRLVQYFHSKTIIELGTSFGISTAYMAVANEKATVFTLEGSSSIAAVAREQFSRLNLENINLIPGNFDDTLPLLLTETGSVDLVFIDGNHRKEPTLRYFYLILNHISPSSVLVFDDIHWSLEMEEAWDSIKKHPSVTLTIDLFFIGIVFFQPGILQKQDFVIRY